MRKIEPSRSRSALSLAAILLTGVTRLAAQTPPDTLRIADAVQVVLDANPSLQAARLNAAGMEERVAPAGAWPDPQIMLGVMNRPIVGFGTGEPMTMNVLQISQTFRWPGKLGFARERNEFLADAALLSADEVGAQLIARLRVVYYELAYLDRAIAISQRTRDLLRDFFQVSQARYSVGEGLQQDVLQAQVAIARMTEDITVMEQGRIAMAARLNALMGREARARVGPLELSTEAPALASADSLFAVAVERRPAIRAAGERVQAAESGYRAARRALYPDLMLSMSYNQRPQFGDMATIMVGFSVPLWAGSKQLPQRREMAAMQAAEEATVRDLFNETFARLTELRADAERARLLSRLYQMSILPQARAAVESALSAYRVGRVDYMTLVESEMTVNRYEIELVRLGSRYHQAVAQIDALLGETGVIR